MATLSVYLGSTRTGRAQRLTVERRPDGRLSYTLATAGVPVATRGIISAAQLSAYLVEGRFTIVQ